MSNFHCHVCPVRYVCSTFGPCSKWIQFKVFLNILVYKLHRLSRIYVYMLYIYMNIHIYLFNMSMYIYIYIHLIHTQRHHKWMIWIFFSILDRSFLNRRVCQRIETLGDALHVPIELALAVPMFPGEELISTWQQATQGCSSGEQMGIINGYIMLYLYMVYI